MPVTLDRPYCTLAEVQAELRNAETDQEDAIKTAINQASRLVDDRCNTDFLQHDHSSTPLDVQPWMVQGDRIFLPWPIIEITEIKETVSGTVYDASNYKVMFGTLDNLAGGKVTGNGEIIMLASAVSTLAASQGAQADEKPLWPVPGTGVFIAIKGKFGYAPQGGGTPDWTAPPPTIPAAIRRATVMIAAALSGLNMRRTIDNQGSRSEFFSTNIPKEVEPLLTRWKIFPF